MLDLRQRRLASHWLYFQFIATFETTIHQVIHWGHDGLSSRWRLRSSVASMPCSRSSTTAKSSAAMLRIAAPFARR